MFWQKVFDIRSRPLSKREEAIYNAGFDDGVKMVIDKLTNLEPKLQSPEVQELVKQLILSHAVETATSNNDA